MKNPQRRENRKVKKALPTLEELGFPNHRKLSRPKKGNRQALKRIARGDFLWNHKKIERLGRRKSNRGDFFHVNLKKHSITVEVKNILIENLTLWNWNPKTSSFQTVSQGEVVTDEELREMALAIYKIPNASTPLKVDNLNETQHALLYSALPYNSALGGTRHQKANIDIGQHEYTALLFALISGKRVFDKYPTIESEKELGVGSELKE